MVIKEDTISIINRTNGQLVGERASALPIRFTVNYSWVKYLIFGFVIAILFLLGIIFFAQQQVITVPPNVDTSNDINFSEIGE